MNADTVISIRGLTNRFGSTVVHEDLSLDVRLTLEDEQALFQAGVEATERFLTTFDHEQWLEDCGR